MNNNEKELIKKAIKSTLFYLYEKEPKCYPCDQCKYGYKNNLKECKNQQQAIKKQHIKWQEKILYWNKQLEKVK